MVMSVLGAQPAHAQPNADQVLSDVGFSADAKQRVLNGEFVTTDVPGVSDKDLSIAIAFLVPTTPEALSQQVMSGVVDSADAQVRASGELKGAASLADLAGLKITSAVAQQLANAQPGAALNLSTDEIAAFGAVPGGAQPAIQRQLQQMLLARFQAYSSVRSGGHRSLRSRRRQLGRCRGRVAQGQHGGHGAAEVHAGLRAGADGYPQATAPGMRQSSRWMSYDIDGTPTFVLTHTLAAGEGTARAVVQRQYYVSTGYNAEQAVAGFVPVQQGTLVVYTNHTFTDQVAGFGGSVKRGVGRRMMASKLEQLFGTARKRVAPKETDR